MGEMKDANNPILVRKSEGKRLTDVDGSTILKWILKRMSECTEHSYGPE
jgi:glutamate-1-semialdehyde aminotransferase